MRVTYYFKLFATRTKFLQEGRSLFFSGIYVYICVRSSTVLRGPPRGLRNPETRRTPSKECIAIRTTLIHFINITNSFYGFIQNILHETYILSIRTERNLLWSFEKFVNSPFIYFPVLIDLVIGRGWLFISVETSKHQRVCVGFHKGGLPASFLAGYLQLQLRHFKIKLISGHCRHAKGNVIRNLGYLSIMAFV